MLEQQRADRQRDEMRAAAFGAYLSQYGPADKRQSFDGYLAKIGLKEKQVPIPIKNKKDSIKQAYDLAELIKKADQKHA